MQYFKSYTYGFGFLMKNPAYNSYHFLDHIQIKHPKVLSAGFSRNIELVNKIMIYGSDAGLYYVLDGDTYREYFTGYEIGSVCDQEYNYQDQLERYVDRYIYVPGKVSLDKVVNSFSVGIDECRYGIALTGYCPYDFQQEIKKYTSQQIDDMVSQIMALMERSRTWRAQFDAAVEEIMSLEPGMNAQADDWLKMNLGKYGN